jgi:hypothetical protein
VVYCVSTHPVPTWLHGTPAGAVLVAGWAAATPVSAAGMSKRAVNKAVKMAVKWARNSLMSSKTPA